MSGVRAAAERHPALAAFLAFFSVAGLARVADYQAPISADAAQYLYVGHTILDGGMPYADAANNKGPLTYLLFAVFDAFPGTSPTSIRLALVPFAALAALALAGWVAHHAGAVVGATAGLAFATLSGIEAFQGADPNTEHFGVAPIFGALWLSTRRGWPAAAGAGVLVGCAALLNPWFAAIAPFVAAELWLGTPRAERLRRLALAAGAGVVPVAAALAWLAAGGALDDMIAQVGGQVGQVGGESGAANALIPESGVSRDVFDLPTSGLWATGVLGCLLAMRDPRLRRVAIPLLLWMGVVVLRTKLSRYEYLNHYYPALPAIVGGIVVGIASLWPERRSERVALAALVLAFPVWGLVVGPQFGAIRDDPNFRRETGAAAYPVADFLKERTEPDDTVLVAGAGSEVYWLADRRAPTRFFDVFGLTGDDDYLAERRRDLERNPPKAIVVFGQAILDKDEDVQRLIASGAYTKAYDSFGNIVWLRT